MKLCANHPISILPILGLMVSARAFGDPSPRQHIRFDDQWKFKIDPNTSIGGKAISEWQWAPAEGIEKLDQTSIPESFASATWKDAHLGDDVFNNRPGYALYRAEFPASILAKGKGKKIVHFDGVDDNCEVFLNGKLLIKHSGWDEPFDVTLDPAWDSSGINRLVVLVENVNGGGGINGQVTIKAVKGEPTPAFANPTFKDADWRTVQLPHDYLLEGKFTPKADASHGSLPQIPAWYRKTFVVPAKWKGKDLSIAFDGVYRNASVWINGHWLGRHTSGYVGFRHDLAPYVHYGSKNVIAVFVDPRQSEGWWYEGAGIYRHVWLNLTNPVHVATYGTYVTSQIHGNAADLNIETKVENGYKYFGLLNQFDSFRANGKKVKSWSGSTNQVIGKVQKGKQLVVRSEIFDPSGKEVGSYQSPLVDNSEENLELNQSVPLTNIKRWSIEHPHLYRLHTTVLAGSNVVDSVDTTFGLRTIRFDANKGFFLNDKPVKLQGTCNHQDFIGVGIAIPDQLFDWRVKKLQEMGSNAYRCSHNPPAIELLDACDRKGMLVMDENRHLGNALGGKTPHGATYDDLPELRELILRDRNHPSVIIWSMCNEEPLQGTEEGGKIFAAMMKEVHRWDKTRPISCAMNGGWGYGITHVEDLQGANYNPGGYDDFHKKFPKMPFYGSETASAVSTRGEYVNDTVKGYVSAYDVNFPSWAQTAQVAWKALADRPYMAGGFVWTGFDYKGEPTPYGWPCINSHFGIMDMCGFPKDSYYYYKAWWGDKPSVHVFPHWNWKGKEGKPINVWVHSNCDEVELFLNGNSLGIKKMPRLEHLEWNVPYTPGSLVAKGYNHHHLAASDRVETTGAPAAIILKADRTKLIADAEDAVPVEVQVVDAKGRIVPYASNMIKFSVTGAGAVAGVGNGDASSHEPDKASQRSAFHGLCMVLVRGKDKPGSITLTASAPGLKGSRVTFSSKATEAEDGELEN